METDTLYYGDCLDWMGQWPDRSVDLIYLDPPFKSDATYNILFGRNGDARGGGGTISRLRRYLALGRERGQAFRQA